MVICPIIFDPAKAMSASIVTVAVTVQQHRICFVIGLFAYQMYSSQASVSALLPTIDTLHLRHC